MQTAKNGDVVSSLWNKKNESGQTVGETFAATNQPEISEYYGNKLWTDQLFYGFNKQTKDPSWDQYSNAGWHGPKRVWFDLDRHQVYNGNGQYVSYSWAISKRDYTKTLFVVEWNMGTYDPALTEATYFAQKNIGVTFSPLFAALFKTRIAHPGSGAVFFGQTVDAADPTLQEGIGYRTITETEPGSEVYDTHQAGTRGSYLGAGDFVADVPAGFKRNNLDGILYKPDPSLNLSQTDFMNGTFLKPELIGNVFNVTQEPRVEATQPPLGKVALMAEAYDSAAGTVSFVAYAWNAMTQTYDVMPTSSQTSGYGFNRFDFSGFNTDPNAVFGAGAIAGDWWIPFLVALIASAALGGATYGLTVLSEGKTARPSLNWRPTPQPIKPKPLSLAEKEPSGGETKRGASLATKTAPPAAAKGSRPNGQAKPIKLQSAAKPLAQPKPAPRIKGFRPLAQKPRPPKKPSVPLKLNGSAPKKHRSPAKLNSAAGFASGHNKQNRKINQV